MYQPKDGDRVRVVLEGRALALVGHRFGVNWGSGSGNEITPDADHVVSIELLAPAEPPVGSVVLDDEGDAAQRLHEGPASWRYAVSEGRTDVLTWSELVDTYSPIRIIYPPDSE